MDFKNINKKIGKINEKRLNKLMQKCFPIIYFLNYVYKLKKIYYMVK